MIRPQHKTLTRALRDRAAWRRRAAHEQRDPDDALETDHSDLRRRSVLQYVEQRNHAVGWKIDVLEGLSGLVHGFAQVEGLYVQQLEHALELRVGQRGKQLVLPGFTNGDHRS